MEADREQLHRRWYLSGLFLVALIMLVMVCYWQTVVYLTREWNQLETGEYAHGYLVLLISAFLVFRQRHSLLQLSPRPDYRALMAVLLSSLLWLVAVLVDVEIVQAVALLLLILSVIQVVMGSEITARLLFPVLFIIFAIPVWFPLAPVLQDLTADVVFTIVRWFRIPAFQQEEMIILPAGIMSVEEACSGMRYLLAALTLGALYGYLNYRTIFARLVVIVLAACAAIVANIIRVFIVVYIGYASEMQSPLVHDHMMLGWYLFGGLVALLIFIDIKLSSRWTEASVESKPAATSHTITGSGQYGISYKVLVMITAALLLISGPVTAYLVRYDSSDQTPVALVFPAGKGGWEGPAKTEDTWMPVFHGAIAQKQAYIKNNNRLYLYIGYYPVQKQGQELITYFNRINNEDVWQVEYTRAVGRETAQRPVLEQVLINAHGQKRLVWYWYHVNNMETTSRYGAKALQVVGMLTGESDAYVIAIAMDIKNDRGQTAKLMESYSGAMKNLLPAIRQLKEVSQELSRDLYETKSRGIAAS